MTDTATLTLQELQRDRDIQRGVELGRQQAFADVQAMLADLITTAEDSYRVNKGSEVGLVAWGQRIALLGAANRVGWLAAQQGRTA